MRHLKLAMVCGALVAATGCLSRTVLGVEDSLDGQTTIINTFDVTNYVVFAKAKYVYWECAGTGDALNCVKRCDVKDDEGEKLLCKAVNTSGFK